MLFSASILLFVNATFAQSNTAPFQQFVPKGFKVAKPDCTGDFNKDGNNDCILIIKNTLKSAWVNDETTANKPLDRNRRGIVILFKTPRGYEKVLENQSLLASENEFGGVYFAPELSLETKNNKLGLHYGHGRYGWWEYTFDYRKIDGRQDFYLIGYDASHNHGPYTESIDSVNFLTQKYQYQKNLNTDWEDDTQKFRTTWYPLPPLPLVKLTQIKDMDELGKELATQLDEIISPNEPT